MPCVCVCARARLCRYHAEQALWPRSKYLVLLPVYCWGCTPWLLIDFRRIRSTSIHIYSACECMYVCMYIVACRRPRFWRHGQSTRVTWHGSVQFPQLMTDTCAPAFGTKPMLRLVSLEWSRFQRIRFGLGLHLECPLKLHQIILWYYDDRGSPTILNCVDNMQTDSW